MATETTNEVAVVTQDTVEEMNQFVLYILDKLIHLFYRILCNFCHLIRCLCCHLFLLLCFQSQQCT